MIRMNWTGSAALTLTLALSVAGCGYAAYEATMPLRPTTDLTRNTVAFADCSRGDNPFAVRADADGSATGRIEGATDEGFPLGFGAIDRNSVRLDLERGAASQDTLSEVMTPVVSGGQTILRGATVDCRNVLVRADE